MIPGVFAKLRLFVRAGVSRRTGSPRRSRRRDSRAALVCGLAAFLAAALGMAAAVETVRPEWREPQFGHRLALLRAGESRSPGRPLVVTIGTSRTQNLIYPGAMGLADEPGVPRVFNLGQSGSPPVKLLLTLHRLLDAGVRPDAVVVELFAPNLVSGGPAESDLKDEAPRLSLSDIEHLAPYCQDAGVFRNAWARARANPWYTQRQVLMNHWLPRWQPWPARFEFQWTSLDANGFQPLRAVAPEARARAIAHARKQYENLFAQFSAGASSVRAMRDLVGVCRREGIRVAFFIPPVSPAFRASFAPGVYSAGEAYSFALGRELDVPVFPAPRDMAEDEFLDGHHAFLHGAERYSRWLAENHLRPWLASQGVGR